MRLLTWTPLVYSRRGFPRDEEGNPFIPSDIILEGISSALIYYFIKKYKGIEAKVKSYLLKKGLSPDEVVEKVKEIVFEKNPVLEDIRLPERIFLPEDKITTIRVEVFDLKKWIDVEEFKVEVFQRDTGCSNRVREYRKDKGCFTFLC